MTTIAVHPPVPLHRLVRVELRKSVDTRAAKAVIGSFLGVGTVFVLAVLLVTPDPTVDLGGVPALFLALALPVIGVLVMTSEWSQRTAAVTFWLTPRRGRVLTAKVAAALVLSLSIASAVLVVFLVTIVAVLAVRGQPIVLDGLREMVTMVLVSAVFTCIFGVAWGALLMSTPLAILVILVPPMLLDLILGAVASDVMPWVSSSTVQEALSGERPLGLTALTSFLLWYGAPLAAGWYLQLRREAR